MKMLPKILFCGLLVASLNACKKKEDSNTDASARANDTTVIDTSADTTTSENTRSTGKFVRRKEKRELTSAEIDSIKAERDKIVTPPDNIGASGTPGSGRAVPQNNKIAPGNNASQGSSTGNVAVKK